MRRPARAWAGPRSPAACAGLLYSLHILIRKCIPQDPLQQNNL